MASAFYWELEELSVRCARIGTPPAWGAAGVEPISITPGTGATSCCRPPTDGL